MLRDVGDISLFLFEINAGEILMAKPLEHNTNQTKQAVLI